MGPVNGGRPPAQVSIDEFKVIPCECGGTEYSEEIYIEHMRHRFNSNLRIRARKARDICKACGKVVENGGPV